MEDAPTIIIVITPVAGSLSRRVRSSLLIITKGTMSRPTTLIIILLTLFISPLPARSEPIPQQVTVVPHWTKGDRFNLVLTRTREKAVDGQSTRSGKTETHVTLEVLKVDKDGYLVGWTAGDTTFDVPTASESLLRQIVGLMKGLRIVLEINQQGTITGVQNWSELKRETVKVLDDLLAKTRKVPQQSSDYTTLSHLREQWESLLGTKEQIERLCTRDAQMYFLALGRAYSSEKPYEYEDRLPNPLGGEPFPARARIALTAFNEQSKQAGLTWTHIADPQQAARIVQSMIKDLASKRGKSAPDGIVAQPIAIDDTADITVDVRTGWITTLTRNQSIQLGTRIQTDRTSIVKVAH